MLRIISFCLLVIAGFQLSGQTNSGKQSITGTIKDDLALLSALNAQFIQNFLHNDTVAHNKIIYKDFVCIAGSGKIVNRNDYMKEWAHGYEFSDYTSFTMQNELIRIFGNTALVRAETPYTYMKDGKEISGTTIYTDTYIKVDGRWWCIQAQLTPKK
jgi:hypothetical protein